MHRTCSDLSMSTPSPESAVLASLSFEAEEIQMGNGGSGEEDGDDDTSLRRIMTEVDQRNDGRRTILASSSTTTTPRASSTSRSKRSIRLDRQQGVLWKRRDIFKNRWRPRWFVLHPGQGVLTYYLLSSSNSAQSNTVIRPSTTTPSAASTRTPRSLRSSSSSNRRRTFSETSHVSSNTVDYDVVPRGMISLLGCTVLVDNENSRPEEDLYAFTINPPAHSTEVKCFLAARTDASRAQWIQRLRQACQTQLAQFEFARGTSSLSSTTTTTSSPGPTTNNDLTMSPIRSLSMPVSSHSVSEQTYQHAGASTPTRSNQHSHQNQKKQCSGSPLPWKTVRSPKLWESIPSELQFQLDQTLQKYLPVLCEEQGWTPLFQKDGLVAQTRYHGVKNRFLLKSEAIVDHPPLQILNLLLDSSRRPQYEPNVRQDKSLHVYNTHTRLDHSAYHAVWPTSARDFAVVLQWRVVVHSHDENRRAILVLATSCPQAESYQPPIPNHVRGHLEVSLNLLEVVHSDDGRNSSNKIQTRHTRLLSYDLMGSIPKHVTNRVMLQQANLPRVLDEFLVDTEPAIAPRFFQSPSNEIVIQEVVNPVVFNKRSRSGVVDEHQQPRQMNNDTMIITEEERSVNASVGNSQRSIFMLAIALAVPTVLYRLVGGNLTTFLVTCWFAIRWVTLAQLPSSLQRAVELPPKVIISCRFSVDLGLASDQGKSSKNATARVVKALSETLKKFPEIQQVPFRVPFFLVDGHFVCNSGLVGVAGSKTSRIMAVQDPENKSILEIESEIEGINANHIVPPTLLSSIFDSLLGSAPVLKPQCVVMTAPNAKIDEVSARIEDIPVTALVSLPRTSRSFESRKGQFFSVCLTFQGPLSLMKCREFAEHVLDILSITKKTA